MKLKNPQAKGKRGEYAMRDMLRGFGFSADRQPMSGAISFLKGDIRTSFPFFVEVKNTETTKFLEWYKKASDQTEVKPPIIAWTKNGEDIYCFLLLSDFLMALTNKSISPIRKPQKPKKVGIEETKQLKFSKFNQIHHGKK